LQMRLSAQRRGESAARSLFKALKTAQADGNPPTASMANVRHLSNKLRLPTDDCTDA